MFGSFLMMPIIVIGTLVKRAPTGEPHFTFGRARAKAPAATPPLSGPEAEVEPS
jgi:hypothetical protein